jgi:putative heme transporter
MKARWAKLGGLAVITVAAGFTVHAKLPDPAQVWGALRTARPWFLLLAAIAQAASLRHFALQQRRLLAG